MNETTDIRPMPTPLPLITSLARSGALDRAWALFRDAGYDAATADPAALAVKGRLLKDQGLRAAGAERARWLGAAEAAYAAADALNPAPWLLINVAALAALQGDAARAAATARHVLARLAAGGVAETAYFIAATRAEALLLCGNPAAADAALAQAMAAQPEGWSDHATTLRQLGLILDAQGADKAWLDRYRPPRSLHFAGHLGVAETGSDALRSAVDTALDEHSIGFGYGALAAGADIVVAEALLARGAELHVFLPVPVSDFLVQSVAPYGAGWGARFAACLGQAASVQIATGAAGAYEPLATALAADTAMGAAILNARLLQSHAVQLLIIDDGDGPFGAGASTARDGAIWQGTPHPQTLIHWPRNAPVAASAGQHEGRADRRLLALLLVRFDGLDRLSDSTFAAALDVAIAPFWAQAERLPGQPALTMLHGNARTLGFASVPAAAAFARRLHALDPPGAFTLTLAGHYGLVHAIAGGAIGPALVVLAEIAAATQPGTTTVSEPFATALALTSTLASASASAPASDAALHVVDLGDHGAFRLFAVQ